METYKTVITLLVVLILVAAFADTNRQTANKGNVPRSKEKFIPIKDKDGVVIGGVHNPEYYLPSKR